MNNDRVIYHTCRTARLPSPAPAPERCQCPSQRSPSAGSEKHKNSIFIYIYSRSTVSHPAGCSAAAVRPCCTSTDQQLSSGWRPGTRSDGEPGLTENQVQIHENSSVQLTDFQKCSLKQLIFPLYGCFRIHHHMYNITFQKTEGSQRSVNVVQHDSRYRKMFLTSPVVITKFRFSSSANPAQETKVKQTTGKKIFVFLCRTF